MIGGVVLSHPAAAEVMPCSERMPIIWSLRFQEPLGQWLQDLPASRIWGTQNMALQRRNVLEVTYPKGSIDPAATTAPQGGAGFLHPTAKKLSSGCLTYEVRFDPNFKFVKGGKLPGLYGGDAPAGGADTQRGFSTRYMWRSGGAGEVYAYLPSKTGTYGESIGRGSWSFVPGQWQRLEQEVAVNHPGQSDGVLRVWVDGKLAIEHTDMVYRTNNDVLVTGLMFSTFFGGHDPSWASPKTQQATFRNFQFRGGAEAR
jgi:hypothetical protein